MHAVVSSRFRIGAFQLGVVTPQPAITLPARTDLSSAWGPPWGFVVVYTSDDPVEPRLIELGVFRGPAIAPTETVVKRVFAAHHQALEGRIQRVERVADALCDLAQLAGLEGITCAQTALPGRCYRIDIVCKTSSFVYVIDEEANNHTIAAILNAVCLHCDLDRLFCVEDEASIVWGPFEPMLRMHPSRNCGVYTASEELPDDWFELDQDNDDDVDDAREDVDVYPPNALSAADFNTITRGMCSVADVIARAIAAGVAALEAKYQGRRFDGSNDNGCLLPVLLLVVVPTPRGPDALDVATAQELHPDAGVGDELAIRITRRHISLLQRICPELNFVQAIETWNQATAHALAAAYAPRLTQLVT